MKNSLDMVWIYCDQLRTDALECYGHPSLRLSTPNLDRLAAEGTRFTNNFCNSPVCVPSRVCSLTGMYPEESGVYNNEAAWRNFRLPRSVDTMPEVFVRHGYQTANFGKIHVARGMYPGETPGREIFQLHNGDGCTMNFWQPFRERITDMLGEAMSGAWPEDIPYPPDRQTANALAWMETVRSPYFMRVSILQPHRPVLPPARYLARLAGQVPSPMDLPEAGLSQFEKLVAGLPGKKKRLTPRELILGQLHYYAQVAWIDDQVGMILDWLEKHDRRSRTVVMFQADHGVYLGEYGVLGSKHTFAPFVHRVPLIISCPSVVPEAVVRDDICDSLDVTRTMLDLGGQTPPSQFRGRHLFGDPVPEAIYSTIGFGLPSSCRAPNGGKGRWAGDRGWPRRSCIRTNHYRLDKNMLIDGRKPDPADEDIFLADVLSDPMETVNLAGDPQYTGVVRALSARLDRHAEGAAEVPPESVLK